MTISLNEIAYDFLEVYRQTFKNNDNVDIRQVKHWVNYERAYLIARMFDKNPFMIPDERLVQELNPNETGISTEIVDASTIQNINSSVFICRTDIDIPHTIDRLNQNGGFTRIGPANKLTSRLPIVSMETAFVSGNGRFNSNQIYAYLDGNKVCFISKNDDVYKLFKYVSIKGVFQNAKEVCLLNNPLYNDDMDYPISTSMIEDMKMLIYKKEIKLSLVQPQEVLGIKEDLSAPQIPAES